MFCQYYIYCFLIKWLRVFEIQQHIEDENIKSNQQTAAATTKVLICAAHLCDFPNILNTSDTE